MRNLLNALTLFGKELPWELPEALFWLLVAQVALILFMVIVFAVLIHRVGINQTIIIEKGDDEEKPAEAVEEQPLLATEEIDDSTMVVYEEGEALPAVVEVIEEASEPVAEPVVEEPVTLEDVAEPVVEEPVEDEAAKRRGPVVIEEMSYEGGILRYDRSFTARLIQSSDEQKEWYGDIKNELLSYKKVKDRLSWKRESYNLGRNQVAKISFRGETLCLYLPLNVADYAETKYKVEDVSENNSYIDTPCLYRIKNAKRARYAKELIAIVMEAIGGVKVEREPENYYLPYEGDMALLAEGLIKRNVRKKKDEAIFYDGGVVPENEPAAPFVIPPEMLDDTFTAAASDSTTATADSTENASSDDNADVTVITPVDEGEAGAEAALLRYDRSFTARIIQSSDEQKDWYTAIKNELLAFAKVHDRISWKWESYNIGRNPIAKIAFRGDTLCLYLPLNPNDYATSKYKVESVLDNASFTDTPCLYRIKNLKRVKYAIELIDVVMEQLEAERTTREPQDYYVPYEGDVELINKGLIKRKLRTGILNAAAQTADNDVAPDVELDSAPDVELVDATDDNTGDDATGDAQN